MIIIAGTYQPVEFLRLTSLSPDQLMFQWKPVSPECSSITYQISPSNCGNCNSDTQQNNATCSTPQLSDTPITCVFSVLSMACGNTFNDSLVATLKGNVLIVHIIVKW